MVIVEKVLWLRQVSLCRNSVIMLSASFLTGVLGYLFHALVSRSLSIAQYGELQSLISLVTVLGVFTSAMSYLGIKYAAILARENDKENGWQLLKWLRYRVWQLATWLLLIYLLFSPLLGRYLNLKDMTGLIIVGAAGLFTVLTVSDLSVLTGWESFGEVGVVNVVGAAVKLVAGVTLAYLVPNASIVIGGCLLASLVVWLLLLFFSGRKFSGVINKAHRSEWQKEFFTANNIGKGSVPILAYSLLIALLGSIDILVVRHLVSPDTTGFYGALSVLGKIILWGNLAVITVVLPRAVAKGYVGERISRRALFGAYSLILGISLVVLVFYYWFSSQIVRLFFGDKYMQYSSVLWLFGAMALTLTLLQLEANFAFARNDWRVSYLLLLTVLMIVFYIYVFRDSVRDIVIGNICVVTIGYIGILLLNYGDDNSVLAS